MLAEAPSIRAVQTARGVFLARDDVLAVLTWLDQQGPLWPSEWSLRVAGDWLRLAPLRVVTRERCVA